MNALFESGLAFLLFLPSFAIMGALYWWFPREPRNAARRVADAFVVLAACIASIIAMRWGFANASGGGRIWPQVLATLLAYGVFLAILAIAIPLRARWLRRSR
jgi:hypothetical protein